MQKKNSGRKIEDFGAEQKRDRALKTSELSRKTSFFSAQIRWEKIDKKRRKIALKFLPNGENGESLPAQRKTHHYRCTKKCKVQ